MEIGTNYQWAVILVCGARPSPNDPVVTSWVKRVPVENHLSFSGLELASIYARKGIWYDTLDTLVAERPLLNNWQNIWSKYLKSASLDQIADKPVVHGLFSAR